MYTLTIYTTQPGGNKLTDTYTDANPANLYKLIREQLSTLISAIEWGMANVAYNLTNPAGDLILETSFFNGPGA